MILRGKSVVATQIPDRSTSFFTPLDRLIQRELNPFIGPDAEHGCLVLIPAQTGIGKTHTIRQAILDELLASQANTAQQRMIYYITNSVDNVRSTYQDLLQLIEESRCTEADKSALESKIVYLPNQAVQLLDTSEDDIDYLIDRFQLKDNKAFFRDWKKLKQQRQLVRDNEAFAAGLRDSIEEKAGHIYSVLTRLIQANQKGEKPVVLDKSDHDILDKLVPGEQVRQGRAKVCFMTTKKFLAGYKTLKGRTHPIRDLGGALLLVDEVDRQNEQILQTMAQQQAIDLIELSKTLYANLSRYRLEKSPLYEGIQERFDELAGQLFEFAKKWQLQYAFNLDGATLERDRVRLFSDRSVTHAHSATHILTLENDYQLEKNFVRSSDRQVDDIRRQEYRLSRFINEADWLFRMFIGAVRSSIWSYTNNASSRDTVPTQQEAVVSILRHLNLQDLNIIVFKALDAQVSFSGVKSSKDEGRSALRPYHDTGLKLTEVRRNEDSHDTVSCYFTGLAMSPSGLLARLVESGAKVVGISATAISKTVVKNFDLEYLKLRLGGQYIELSERQKHAIGEYYRSRRRYEERGVQVIPEFVRADRSMLKGLLEQYLGKPVRKQAAVIAEWLGKSDDEKKEYLLDWVSRLVQSLQMFALKPGNRYMLVLLNRKISPSHHSEFMAFLKWVMTGSKATAIHLHSLDSAALKADRFDEVQQKLSNSTDKVVVLSTYATMGEGKNPDYKVKLAEDRQQLIWVGDGPEPEHANTDIDTLYLEKPSHQLLSDEDYQTNQLLQLHQIMSLQNCGSISPEEGLAWTRRFLVENNHMDNLQRYYNTDDYLSVIQKVLEQAIGRSARTAFKRARIQLMADEGVVKALALDERQQDILSLEYAALRDRAVTIYGDDTSADRKTLPVKNRARLYTADTLGLIQELMRGFHGLLPQGSIDSWEALRKQLLQRPVIAEPSGFFPRLYINTPTTEGYRFSGNLENDSGLLTSDRDLHFFDDIEANRWISESESGLPELMRHPVVKRHFKAHGFATHWPQGHWMMNPAAFFNLYKGALGEEGIIAILSHAGFLVEPMPVDVYERFDFLIRLEAQGKTIAVDAKHWSSPGDIDNHQQKIQRLKEMDGIEHFAYINLFGSTASSCRRLGHDFIPVKQADSPVLEVAGLIEKSSGTMLEHNLMELLLWAGDLT
jgi:hypothetical protein